MEYFGIEFNCSNTEEIISSESALKYLNENCYDVEDRSEIVDIPNYPNNKTISELRQYIIKNKRKLYLSNNTYNESVVFYNEIFIKILKDCNINYYIPDEIDKFLLNLSNFDRDIFVTYLYSFLCAIKTNNYFLNNTSEEKYCNNFKINLVNFEDHYNYYSGRISIENNNHEILNFIIDRKSHKNNKYNNCFIINPNNLSNEFETDYVFNQLFEIINQSISKY